MRQEGGAGFAVRSLGVQESLLLHEAEAARAMRVGE